MSKLKNLLCACALLMGVAALVLPSGGTFPIDIKPGSDPNCMDRGSKGVVSMAVDPGMGFISTGQVALGSTSSCAGEKAPALRCKAEDVPGFGDAMDEVCHFSSADLRTAGVMPAAGTCKTVYLCLGNDTFSRGQGTLCDAKSLTCSQ